MVAPGASVGDGVPEGVEHRLEPCGDAQRSAARAEEDARGLCERPEALGVGADREPDVPVDLEALRRQADRRRHDAASGK